MRLSEVRAARLFLRLGVRMPSFMGLLPVRSAADAA
jgi:hypothetical protein